MSAKSSNLVVVIAIHNAESHAYSVSTSPLQQGGSKRIPDENALEVNLDCGSLFRMEVVMHVLGKQGNVLAGIALSSDVEWSWGLVLRVFDHECLKERHEFLGAFIHSIKVGVTV